MTRMVLLWVLAGLTLVAGVRADAPAVGAVPEGTEVRVRLKQTLRSGRDRKGDAVRFEVSADVRGVDGTVLIPAGTPASGVVEQSSRAGRFGRGGRLRFTCDAVHPAQGNPIPLRSDSALKRNGGNPSGSGLVLGGLAGAATALVLNAPYEPAIYFGPRPPARSSGLPGSIIGAGVGLLVYALIPGKNATAREGSEFLMRVTSKSTAAGSGVPTPSGEQR